MWAGSLRRVAMISLVAMGAVVLVMVSGRLASAEATASLTIKVEALGPSHGFAFSGSHATSAGSSASFSTTLAHGDEYVLDDLDTSDGRTVFIEQALQSEPLLWRLSEISCVEIPAFPFALTDDVDFIGDVQTGKLDVEPAPGQHIVCTFTNDYVAGALTFATEVDAADSNQVHTWDPDQEFVYNTYLSTDQTGITRTDGETFTDTALPVPGQYSVYQQRVPGWETEVTCVGSAQWSPGVETDGSIYVHADFVDDQWLFCTFTNTYVASSLTIEVEALGPLQDFEFYGSSDAPTDDPTTSTATFEPTLADGEQHTQYFIVGDLIHVAVDETVPPGWEVTGIECVKLVDGPFGSVVGIDYEYSSLDDVDVDRGHIELHPAPGVNVKCTFTNRYVAGRLSFGPTVLPGSDLSQVFTYNAQLGELGGDVVVPLRHGQTYGSDLVDVPRQYGVVQEAQPGWATTVACLGGDVVGTGTYADGDTYVHIDIGENEQAHCTFENEYVNTPPVADAGGPYTVDEAASFTLDGTGSSDPDGDDLTYAWDLDGDGQFDDAVGATPSWHYPDGPDTRTVRLRVTDLPGESDVAEVTVTVDNVAPLVAPPLVDPAPSDEGAAVVATATFSDPAGEHDEPYACTVDYGDGAGPAVGTVDGSTCTGPSHVYRDDGAFVVAVTVTDKDGASGSATVGHEVANVAPAVSLDLDAQTVQYSDLVDVVTITATDVAADTLDATLSPPDLDLTPQGLGLTPQGCVLGDVWQTCTWTLSGAVHLPAGVHTLSVDVRDEDGGATTATIELTVLHEDAVVAFGSDNPIVVPVTEDGSDQSEPFSLLAYVREAPETGDDVAPGDINLAEVHLTLEPVGPGQQIGPVPCDATALVAAFDDAAELEVRCSVGGIPVNAYVATVSIGGDHYRGTTDEDVVVVYDPSLGFTTGGGWFTWPGTGERTTFGYTMKYNKKATNAQGSMVLIRRTADGERYRVKSNAIFGLALGETPEMGWATFLGKATYLEPGMDEPVGNHTFMVHVEDRDESGDADRFWIEVLDKDGSPVGLSLDRPADLTAAELGGGNIVVPHTPGNGAR